LYSRITDRQCSSGSANCQRQSQTPRENWEWATKEELKYLARMMIQEVGVDVAAKRVIWIKACPDFDVLFQLLNNLRVDEQRRFWIAYPEADEDTCVIREDLGQMGTEVKIVFPMSHNAVITHKSPFGKSIMRER
jgi:hypothetical protein